MRDIGSLRNVFVPDSDAPDGWEALNYEGAARAQLGILKNLMSFNNLEQLCRTVVLTDGTQIFVQSVFGQDTIKITPPLGGAVPAPEEVSQSKLLESPSTIIVGASGNDSWINYPCMWINNNPKALPIPEASLGGYCSCISRDGSTIGGYIGAGGIAAAFWDRKSLALTYLDTNMPVPTWGGTDNTGYFSCISRDGSILVGVTPHNVNSIGFIYNRAANTITALPFIELPNTPISGNTPLGCTKNAEIIVGYTRDRYSWLSGGSVLPVIWTQDPDTLEYTASFLPLPDGTSNGVANSITPDGSIIIGTAYFSPTPNYNGRTIVSNQRNVIWIGGQVIDLGAGSGGIDISDDGNTLLVWTNNGHSATIKRDESGNYTQYTDLGNPPVSPEGSSLTAYAISGDGSIVVGSTGFSAYKWQGGQYALLSPSVPGYIGYANDVAILNPDTTLDVTIQGPSLPA